jgi:hypothetical protein
MALADYLDSIPDDDLIAMIKCLETIIRNNLQSDRVVIPALETVAGLFEEGVFSRIEQNYKYKSCHFFIDLSFRTLFILAQKVGYKSGNIMKLLSCVRLYVYF